MPLAFTKEEIEEELSGKLHRHRRDIARRSGLGESYIKRQFNANDDTPSCAFKMLQIACAFDDIDAAEGEVFWQAFVQFRELSKPVRPIAAKSLNQETGKLNKEIADFVAVKLADQPYDVQMRELLEARRQLDIVHKQLIAEHQSLIGNGDQNKVVNFKN